MNSIYESAEDIDAVIDPAVDIKHNQEPSSKKKKDQQKEQEVLSLHPYLAKRDSQLKRLYAQRARAVINGSASQDQIKREIDSLKSEMQQYVDTRKLDLKVWESWCPCFKDIAENVEISDVLILKTSIKTLKTPMSSF